MSANTCGSSLKDAVGDVVISIGRHLSEGKAALCMGILPEGHTPGASILLRIPHGARRFAISLPKCVQAILERVYESERTLGSIRNEPDEDTDNT